MLCFMYVVPMYLLYVVAIQKILNLNNIISGENMLSSDAHQQLGAGKCATLMEMRLMVFIHFTFTTA
jgi:hypothetical protein